MARIGTYIEAVCNFLFHLLVFLIVILPPLIFIQRLFSGKTGGLWVLAAILFAIVAPALVKLFLPSFFNLAERIKKGELWMAFFRPLKQIGSVIGIYGVFKLEYALIHGHAGAENTNWLDVIWKFLTTF